MERLEAAGESSREVLEYGCRVLVLAVCHSDLDLVAEANISRMVQILVRGVQEYTQDLQVLAPCLTALRKLIEQPFLGFRPSRRQVMFESLVEANLIPVLVSLLQQHARNNEICLLCLSLLRHLKNSPELHVHHDEHPELLRTVDDAVLDLWFEIPDDLDLDDALLQWF
jgi:hypothetical protein